MGFKFDDDDDELSLDSKTSDKVKTNIPTPLPNVVKTPKEEEVEVIQPAPKKPAPRIPVVPSKPTVPLPKQTPVAPAVDPVIQEETEANDAYSEEAYIAEEPEQYIEEPKASKVNVRATQPKTTSRSTARTRAKVVTQDNIDLTSENTFAPEETKSSIRKKGEFYKNDRQTVTRIRIIAASVAGILILAGIYSFIPKPGFSEDIGSINTSITYGNKYNSIMQASEGFALRFATDFLDRTEYTEPNRRTKMGTYMSSDALAVIDYKLNTVTAGNSADGIPIYQRILSGPYANNFLNVDSVGIQAQRIMDGNGYVVNVIVSAYVQDYVFAVQAADLPIPELTSRWVFLSIPVVHNYETKETTLYGYPTFINPDININFQDYVAPYDTADWTSTDDALTADEVLKARFEGFLASWAAQDPNSPPTAELKGFLLTDHNIRAERGLDGAYQAAKDKKIISSINVEAMPQDVEPTTATERTALVTVGWVDSVLADSPAINPSIYKQQYIITFSGDSNGWYIIDIRPRYSEK